VTRERIQFCTSSDGVRLAYAVAGRGLPLVKVANWLTHLEFDWQSAIWGHWAQQLSRDFTYVRHDARGCGLSDRSPRDISFQAWVRDLEAIVDAQGFERVALLGVSQGGAIAAAYAAQHPERVSHLVAYGACARGELKRGGGAEMIEQRLVYHKLAQLGWGRNDNIAFRQAYSSRIVPDATPEELDSFDELQRIATTAEIAVRCMRVMDQVDMTEVLPRVACPTLVMHTRHDRNVPFEEGRLFATLIPGARFVPLDGRDHILLANDAAWRQFLEEIRAFLHASRAAFPELTGRERELLEFLARGLDNHQIAAHLDLSEKTVRNMVSSILGKLEVESRSAAIVRARTAGFGQSTPAT
jgi:pimeloyl-ACP methyl ester carboxylesterase/DNA-binding CsgD family transcriptional regulator